MKKLVALLCCLSLLLPRLAWADEPEVPFDPTTPSVKPIPPGPDVIEPVTKGAPAPFSGQLFDPYTALRWANYLEQYKHRLFLEREHARLVQEAQDKFHEKTLAAEQEKYKTVVMDLEQKNADLQKELEHPPFYKTTWFGVIVGAVAMGTAVGLAAWGLSATNR